MSSKFDEVDAFEPLTDVSYRLPLLSEKNINIHDVALSDRQGSRKIYLPTIGGKPNYELATFNEQSSGESRTVQSTTLDSFALSDVDLLKIDVEGHEFAVLSGSRETIQRSQPVIIIEIEQRHLDIPISEVFRCLVSMGYRGFFIDKGQSRSISEFSIETHQLLPQTRFRTRPYINNFIFAPSE